MNVLIKNAVIVDQNSKFHLQKKDIYIHGGIIQKIGEQLSEKADKIIDENDVHVSIGWVDMQANFRDPGNEHKENIMSGAKAASKGGFTKVCIQSSTSPTLDTKAQIEYIKRISASLPADVLPIGAVTTNREGKEMAELFDMHQAGAIAFSDDKRAIENPKLLELALTYTKNFDGLIIHYPESGELTKNALMHEGDVSVSLGFKGAASLAEGLAVSRDLYLLKYTEGKLHYNLISAMESLDLIRKAKEENLNVTCGVGSHQLYFNDKVVESFDSVHKVKPPYRSEEHKAELINGLINGTIDVICSDHSPEDSEHKNVEFEYAKDGIIHLQTCFAVANTVLSSKMGIDKIIEKLTDNPRKILGLTSPKVEENEPAELTIFQPNEKFIFTKEMNESLSENSPFFEVELKGKVLGTYTKGSWN